MVTKRRCEVRRKDGKVVLLPLTKRHGLNDPVLGSQLLKAGGLVGQNEVGQDAVMVAGPHTAFWLVKHPQAVGHPERRAVQELVVAADVRA